MQEPALKGGGDLTLPEQEDAKPHVGSATMQTYSP